MVLAGLMHKAKVQSLIILQHITMDAQIDQFLLLTYVNCKNSDQTVHPKYSAVVCPEASLLQFA